MTAGKKEGEAEKQAIKTKLADLELSVLLIELLMQTQPGGEVHECFKIIQRNKMLEFFAKIKNYT